MGYFVRSGAGLLCAVSALFAFFGHASAFEGGAAAAATLLGLTTVLMGSTFATGPSPSRQPALSATKHVPTAFTASSILNGEGIPNGVERGRDW